jgi:hypothetical protein
MNTYESFGSSSNRNSDSEPETKTKIITTINIPRILLYCFFLIILVAAILLVGTRGYKSSIYSQLTKPYDEKTYNINPFN